MTVVPASALVLAMLLPAQVQPVDPLKGAKGVQPAGPVPPGMPGIRQPAPTVPPNPMRPGQPLWWLTTQVPLWVFLVLAARRQQQARAAHVKMLAEEEENQTPYNEEDLMQDFEFKIVRNELGLFDQPELLAETLREEARAGWQLVEKFDGNRLRLKRPAGRRAGDSALPPDFDAYRTAALPEATKAVLAAKRLKELKIWGGVLAGSAAAAVVLGVAATTLRNDLEFLRFLSGFTAVCAGVVAAICLIGLIVRFLSK